MSITGDRHNLTEVGGYVSHHVRHTWRIPNFLSKMRQAEEDPPQFGYYIESPAFAAPVRDVFGKAANLVFKLRVEWHNAPGDAHGAFLGLKLLKIWPPRADLWAKGQFAVLPPDGTPPAPAAASTMYTRSGTCSVYGMDRTFVKEEFRLNPHRYFLDGALTLTASLSVLCSTSRVPRNADPFGDLGCRLWETREITADVTVKCVGGDIKADKNVLMAASDVFRAMFAAKDMRENRSGVVDVTDVEIRYFEEFLHFLYTNKPAKKHLWTDLGSLEMLLRVADKYDLRSMVSHCEERLELLLSADNFGYVGAIADFYSSAELKKAVVHYIKMNYLKVRTKGEQIDLLPKDIAREGMLKRGRGCGRPECCNPPPGFQRLEDCKYAANREGAGTQNDANFANQDVDAANQGEVVADVADEEDVDAANQDHEDAANEEDGEVGNEENVDAANQEEDAEDEEDAADEEDTADEEDATDEEDAADEEDVADEEDAADEDAAETANQSGTDPEEFDEEEEEGGYEVTELEVLDVVAEGGYAAGKVARVAKREEDEPATVQEPVANEGDDETVGVEDLLVNAAAGEEEKDEPAPVEEREEVAPEGRAGSGEDVAVPELLCEVEASEDTEVEGQREEAEFHPELAVGEKSLSNFVKADDDTGPGEIARDKEEHYILKSAPDRNAKEDNNDAEAHIKQEIRFDEAASNQIEQSSTVLVDTFNDESAGGIDAAARRMDEETVTRIQGPDASAGGGYGDEHAAGIFGIFKDDGPGAGIDGNAQARGDGIATVHRRKRIPAVVGEKRTSEAAAATADAAATAMNKSKSKEVGKVGRRKRGRLAQFRRFLCHKSG